MSNPSLSEPRRAAAHDLALTHQLSVELRSVQREIDVKVDAVECTLWCIHAFEILFKVLAGEIGCQCDNFLDTCTWLLSSSDCDYCHAEWVQLTRILGVFWTD